MICVCIERSKKGVLLKCNAEGHAGYAKSGFDIVCSAVSVLMKTALLVLKDVLGIKLKIQMPKRGFLSFEIESYEFDSDVESKLINLGDFLQTGINAVVEEYPQYVELVIKTV